MPGSQSIYQLTKLAIWPRNGPAWEYVLLVDQIGSGPGEFESRTSLIVVMVGRCGHTIYKAAYRLNTHNKHLFLNESIVLYQTPNSTPM